MNAWHRRLAGVNGLSVSVCGTGISPVQIEDRPMNTRPVLILLALTLPAAAEEPLSLLGRTDLDCPVCRQRFETVVCTQSNTRGGVDRDLFARALGPQPEFYRISTCPRCGYSGYLGDFDPAVALPPDVREKILTTPRLALPDGFTPERDPRELDARDRYRLAIECYRWRQRSDEALAWLHLRASWIAREEGAVLPPEPRLTRVLAFIERWKPPLPPGGNQVSVEMQLAARTAEAIAAGEFNRYQKPYVELALALILRRHGENRQAAPLLDRLSGHDGFPEAVIAAIGRMRASIDAEKRHQVEAAACFERALLANQISAANRPAACYLLGELSRRLGRDRDAVRWFDEALRDKTLPADLRTWAAEQKNWCAGRG